MLQINMSTQPARIEYTLQNARLNLRSTQPQLKMETAPGKLEIHQPRGELTIDQTPCRYSIGLKNNADFARDNAALGRQSVKKMIARTVAEGYQLAQIENKTNAIPEIAAESMHSEVPELTLATIALPDIHYQANPVQFTPIEGKVKFDLQRGTVQGDYQPGSVDIRVIQYPSLEISALDVKV